MPVAVDDGPAAAEAHAAAAFVSGSGATLQPVSVDRDQVTVAVTAMLDSWFPTMSDRTVTESSTARVGRAHEGSRTGP